LLNMFNFDYLLKLLILMYLNSIHQIITDSSVCLFSGVENREYGPSG
jgi:hypothetical protein